MIGVNAQPGVWREAAHASSAEPSGLLFDIMRYSLHDGPGIRTTVFFKGCPLSCWWCHNPEGQSPKPNLMFFEKRCMGCGDCIQVCPHGAILRRNGVTHTTSACQVCGTCAETCPSAARKVAGRWMTVSEAMREIERDLIFWDESGGGVTFSGGEPLAQPRFLESLLDACREKRIHTVVETCGLAKKELVLHLSEKVDLFLFDLKILDPLKHKKYTGVPNDSILANLEALAQRKKPVVVRFPVIPEINDDSENIRQMVALLSRLHLRRVHLLPYHQTGTEKYKRLGLGFRLEDVKVPPPSLVAKIAGEFEGAGFNVKIGG
ncbi:MAG: glycyl-radical enzyme activating protein [Terriglobia bacterium]